MIWMYGVTWPNTVCLSLLWHDMYHSKNLKNVWILSVCVAVLVSIFAAQVAKVPYLDQLNTWWRRPALASKPQHDCAQHCWLAMALWHYAWIWLIYGWLVSIWHVSSRDTMTNWTRNWTTLHLGNPWPSWPSDQYRINGWSRSVESYGAFSKQIDIWCHMNKR